MNCQKWNYSHCLGINIFVEMIFNIHKINKLNIQHRRNKIWMYKKSVFGSSGNSGLCNNWM